MASSTAVLADQQDPRNRGPHPVLHYINELLHTAPFDFLFYGWYWTVVLVLFSPLVGIVMAFLTAGKFVLYLLGWRERRVDHVSKDGKDRELAVVITGCDSGFGCDLAHALSRKGYVVFAGCLAEESMKQYEDDPRAFPLKMDVTKDDEVQAASRQVSLWLSDAQTASKSERILHAIVNNAGIGDGGLIDWLDISTFQRNMDVNYFGMIRTVKAFYPILKSQAAQSAPYPHARVVNMVSCAGLITSGLAAPYFGSKFAAEAFSSCLSHELTMFGVKVVTVNPSFHSTPLTNSMRSRAFDKWNAMPKETRDEYGEDMFERFVQLGIDIPKQAEWRAKVVTQELTKAIELIHPSPQMVVGCDGKYVFLLNRHLPVWFQNLMRNLTLPHATPKILQTHK